jgi:hypothetical protein
MLLSWLYAKKMQTILFLPVARPAYCCAEERIIWKTMQALKEYYSSVKLN